ncbi:MAG TPA: hypothetical protein VI522_00395 [Gammaproteobacteria bacterium]|nr:hypothetical protein [Gammaproteobacteria bacterium]
MDELELAVFLDTINAMELDKLVKLFVKTRDAKSAAKKLFDAQESQFNQIMDRCENLMLAKADATGVTGFNTPFGTTYIAETKKISIADDSAFFAFVKSEEDLDFFERRVSVSHVDKYMEINGGVLPPGLNLFKERVMRVRKASAK